MNTLKLQFDFMAGPVWCEYFDPETRSECTDISAVDNDPAVWKVNRILQNMYTDCYEFDVDDQPCVFKKENADPAVMLDYLRLLKERLDEINDGSFVVEDYATPELLHWNED